MATTSLDSKPEKDYLDLLLSDDEWCLDLEETVKLSQAPVDHSMFDVLTPEPSSSSYDWTDDSDLIGISLPDLELELPDGEFELIPLSLEDIEEEEVSEEPDWTNSYVTPSLSTDHTSETTDELYSEQEMYESENEAKSKNRFQRSRNSSVMTAASVEVVPQLQLNNSIKRKRECSEEEVPVKKQRRSWTEESNTVLLGVIFTLFLYVGTTSFSLESSPVSWESVKNLVRTVCERGNLEWQDRPASALHRAFRELKRTAKQGHVVLIDLYETWKNVMNQNNCLLTSDDVKAQFNLKKQNRKRNDNILAPMSSRSNTWTKLQDAMLVGIVTEYMFEAGSLNSTGKNCWLEICQRYTNAIAHLSGSDVTVRRKAGALKRRYKNLRATLADVNFDDVHPYSFVRLYEDFLLETSK